MDVYKVPSPMSIHPVDRYTEFTNLNNTVLSQGEAAGAVFDGTNPKDLLGSKKVDMFAVPPIAIAHEACAMMDGEWKYGFRNWREKDVRARIYVAAALRHLLAWAEGQDTAEDSGVHHLGHARACMAILLDAQATGNLIDDRVKGEYATTLAELNEWVVERSKKYH